MFSQFTCILIAMLLMLSGAWVQWRAPWYRMDAEEAMKDGKLSQQQVDQRLNLIRRGSWCLTLTGVVLLVACLVYCDGW
jgi:hypothetical protein